MFSVYRQCDPFWCMNDAGNDSTESRQFCAADSVVGQIEIFSRMRL